MIRTHEKYHRKGFCLSSKGNDQLEVQKIDFPEDWKIENDYDFDIPKLASDEEAKKEAEKMGVIFYKNSLLVKSLNQ